MRWLILLLVGLASAVESGPYPIVRSVDGDTAIVRIGAEDVRVRLLWIDTPESKSNKHGDAMPEGKSAAAALAALLPAGGQTFLWGPKDALERDAFGRLLAVAYLGEVVARTGPDAGQPARRATSVQEDMIAAGWSPY